MKTRNIILYFIALLSVCSCQDMFSPADENTRQEDAMYLESEYANGLLMYGYSRLFQGGTVSPYMNSSTTDVATDDAVSNQSDNAFKTMASGTWASDRDPMSMWNSCKDGIQYINKFLTIVDKATWSPSAKSKQKMFVDRLSGEAYAIRAILYYNLLMAHGGYGDDGVLYGVPLLTKPEDGSSDFNQPRALFSECVKQCFEDCDSAMALLPLDYNDIDSNDQIPERYQDPDLGAVFSGYNSIFGIHSRNRISGRIAEAVKAQIALLASSPAFREPNGVTSADAALLAANVLKHNDGMAGFDKNGHLDWYSSTYKTFIDGTVPEVIWRADRSKDNTYEKANFPPSLYGNGRVNPSQNLVDAFPMNNGLPITDPNSGYDPQNPYANRDMRLANTVIYNGMKFKTANILTGFNMPYGKDNQETNDNLNDRVGYSTRTGYYLKKLLREDVSANPSSQSPQNHIYPRIRYTEIYLAYAEAANDAWGPNADPTGVGFTAYDVIKAIRERAGIGKDEFGRDLPGGDLYIEQVKNDKNKMAELIRNERRLELCFENKRFWDLRRWLLPLNEPIKGMKVEKINPEDENSALKYSVFELTDEKRDFDNSYQCYGPIPKEEILKWSNLIQNKGWR